MKGRSTRLISYVIRAASAATVIGTFVFAASAPSFAAGFTTKAELALVQRGTTTYRSKGVKTATNPSTGIYCITPKSKLNFDEIYPQLTIEWANS